MTCVGEILESGITPEIFREDVRLLRKINTFKKDTRLDNNLQSHG